MTTDKAGVAAIAAENNDDVKIGKSGKSIDIPAACLGGGKYSGVDSSTVERIYVEMSAKYGSQKEIIKAVKKELHIIYGSFLQKANLPRVHALIDGYAGADARLGTSNRTGAGAGAETQIGTGAGMGADASAGAGVGAGLDAVAGSGTDMYASAGSDIGTAAGSDIGSDRAFAARLMALHASTSERLRDAEAIYGFIGSRIKPGDTLVDLGCGFNPFALPYLNARPAVYIAYDICVQTIALINKYFALVNPAYCARILDAAAQSPVFGDGKVTIASGGNLAAAPGVAADAIAEAGNAVLLMLKLFPLLERQKKGRACELLSAAHFRTAIVSFPTKSASGRDVGMEAFYSERFARSLPEGLIVADKAVFENEMLFVVNK